MATNKPQTPQEEKLARIRHSMSHVMAEAVLEMFPSAQIAIGPAIEDGFYYDFELPRPLENKDLDEITERMKKIIAQNKPFVRKEVSREEAREMFKDQKYKLELLDAIPEGRRSPSTTRADSPTCAGDRMSLPPRNFMPTRSN